MSVSSKPTWLKDYQGLLEVTKFNLFAPSDMGNFTSLKDVSAFTRGLKQFLYWKGQLLPSLTKTTVFLAFLGPQGLTFPNVLNVAKALKSACDFTQLIETHTGANSNFLAFSFTNSSVVQEIIDNFKYFEDTVVLSVAYSGEELYRFRLLWLPPLFDVARVHHLLGGFTQSHRLKRESINLGDGQYSYTNVVSGTLSIKPGETIDNLPHLIRLPTPHKGCALLYIESRPPLCLKCRATGHTRKKCLMVRCTSCLKVHFPSAACGTSSYSTVAAKGITTYKEDNWISRLADDFEEDTGLQSGQDTEAPQDMVTLNTIENNTQLKTPNPSSTSVDKNLDQITLEVASEEKCGLTSSVFSGCNSLTDTTVDFTLHSSSVLTTKSDITSSKITSSTQKSSSNSSSSSDKAAALQLVAVNTAAFSPPITRSQSSVKKRLISTSVTAKQALHSEIIPYHTHSAKNRNKQVQPIMITPHFLTIDSPKSTHDVSMDFVASDEQEELSDVSVILTSDNESMDTLSSRKRKISHPSSLEDNSHPDPVISDAPSNTDNSTSSELSSSTVHAIMPSSSSSSSDHISSLSEADAVIASQLSLSPTDLLKLKLSCPNQEFSPTILKKLGLLIAHSIPVLQAAEHPQFFNLKPSAISSRLKTLEKHQASMLKITDLFQSSDSFDRMAGILPPPQYILPKLSADPFLPPNS